MYLLFIFIGVVIVYGPSLWVRWVMYRYGKHIEAMPGTGADLAKHLIEQYGVQDTHVEKGGNNVNHFDPADQMVRLSPENFDGKSLTAVAVAAHEVGHAIQYHRRERLIVWRCQMLPKVAVLEKISAGVLVLAPLVGVATRIPQIALLMVVMIIAFMFSRIVFHLTTLPVEWDASFNKALPILVTGNYVPTVHVPAVRQVLKAAALTYVAAALADLLSFWRWFRFIH